MKVSSETAAASGRFPSPEPWVPVAQAPATEMCGSEPRLCSAFPSACSAAVTSPYRSPAEIVTAESSIVITRGRSSTETSVPEVSAIRLNECPVPSTRTFSDELTSSCNASTESGAWTSEEKVMFPAQFVPIVHTFRSPGSLLQAAFHTDSLG